MLAYVETLGEEEICALALIDGSEDDVGAADTEDDSLDVTVPDTNPLGLDATLTVITPVLDSIPTSLGGWTDDDAETVELRVLRDEVVPVWVGFAVTDIDDVPDPVRLCEELPVPVPRAVVVRLTLWLLVSVVDAVELRVPRTDTVADAVPEEDRDTFEDAEPLLLTVEDTVPDTVRLYRGEALPETDCVDDLVEIRVDAGERDPDADLLGAIDRDDDTLVVGECVGDPECVALCVVVIL
jgi:hypothetical protein